MAGRDSRLARPLAHERQELPDIPLVGFQRLACEAALGGEVAVPAGEGRGKVEIGVQHGASLRHEGEGGVSERRGKQ